MQAYKEKVGDSIGVKLTLPNLQVPKFYSTYPLVTHFLNNETNQGNSSFCQSSLSPKEVSGMLLKGPVFHNVQQKYSRGSEISGEKKRKKEN